MCLEHQDSMIFTFFSSVSSSDTSSFVSAVFGSILISESPDGKKGHNRCQMGPRVVFVYMLYIKSHL